MTDLTDRTTIKEQYDYLPTWIIRKHLGEPDATETRHGDYTYPLWDSARVDRLMADAPADVRHWGNRIRDSRDIDHVTYTDILMPIADRLGSWQCVNGCTIQKPEFYSEAENSPVFAQQRRL